LMSNSWYIFSGGERLAHYVTLLTFPLRHKLTSVHHHWDIVKVENCHRRSYISALKWNHHARV
jgi:hypothetical protein